MNGKRVAYRVERRYATLFVFVWHSRLSEKTSRRGAEDSRRSFFEEYVEVFRRIRLFIGV